MMSHAATLVLLACLIFFAIAASPITPQDKESYRQIINAQLNSASKIADKAEQTQVTHAAVASLLKLKLDKESLNEDKKKQICATVVASPSDSPKTIYENVVLSIALSCSSVDFSKVQDTVKQALSASSTSIQDTYYLARIVTLLKKQVPALAQSVNPLTSAFERVFTKYDDAAAAFCADGSKCIKQTGYAYETLSMIYTLINAVDAKEGEKQLGSLVKVSRNTDKAVKRINSALPISDLSAFARGLNKLASIVPSKKISRDDVNSIANALLANKQQITLEGIYDLVEGLASLNSIFVPVIVSELTHSNDGAFQVSVSDVFGNAFDMTSVSLSRVFNARSNDVVASNVQLTASGTTYSWKPSSDSILEQLKSAGMFNFEYSIVPSAAKSSFPQVTITRSFISESNASVKSFSFAVSNEKEVVVSYPGKMSQEVAVENANDKRVAVTVSLDGTPHQVFLRFVNKATQQDAVVALKRQEGSVYRLDINFEKIAGDLFRHASGSYDLQVLVGDVAFKQSISWTVGSVSLTFKTPKRGDKEEEAELYALKPEIQHKFNPPAKRAPAAISSAFTIASVAPLGLLFIGLLTVGFNLGNCPGGLGFIFGLVFHVLIAAMLGVIFLYWVQLTIFEAFTYLGVLGLAAALVGSKQLNDIARN